MSAHRLRSAALLARIPRPDVSKLLGRVRETCQYDPDLNGIHLRYDFAFVDPASGRREQHAVDALATPLDLLDARRMRELVTLPALSALARYLHRKCGIERALQNQISLRST